MIENIAIIGSAFLAGWIIADFLRAVRSIARSLKTIAERQPVNITIIEETPR